MRKDQIAAFVSEILAAGAPMCAIGDDTYVFAEVDVPDEHFDRVSHEVNEICERYGSRDHLRREISAHLRSIGRYVEVEDVSKFKLWLSRFVLRKPAATPKARGKVTLN